jgi:hypothetical protein
LDWKDATRICRQVRKIAEQEKSAGGNQTGASRTAPSSR